MSFTTGNMQTRSFRTRSCFRCLWVLLTAFLCEGGTELSNTHSSGQLSGQLTPYMLLFFLVALISMVLATQSIYFAYLGFAVARQWPQPKLSGLPYNDRMRMCCSQMDVSLYNLNCVLTVVWIVGLGVFTGIWCAPLGAGSGCCTNPMCFVVGAMFWLIPSLHLLVVLVMIRRFVKLGWPLRARFDLYAPLPGAVVTGIADIVDGSPVVESEQMEEGQE